MNFKKIIIPFCVIFLCLSCADLKVDQKLQADVRAELKNELRGEVKAELRAELTAEVKAELRVELKNEVNTELRANLQAEIEAAIQSAKQDNKQQGTAGRDNTQVNFLMYGGSGGLIALAFAIVIGVIGIIVLAWKLRLSNKALKAYAAEYRVSDEVTQRMIASKHPYLAKKLIKWFGNK